MPGAQSVHELHAPPEGVEPAATHTGVLPSAADGSHVMFAGQPVPVW
jgi:hypothetical protein